MNEESIQVVAPSAGSGSSALICFALYLVGVIVLAWLSGRESKGKKFVSEYFLGSRSLGVWAFALTFAATSASGGSFVGFPSLIYTHGWVLALWIASYMLVPLVAMALLGKRLNQVARKAGAVTLPEVLRERFGSAKVGLVATSMLIIFMFFYLVAQFKAGAEILATLFEDIGIFQSMVGSTAQVIDGVPWIGRAAPDFFLCLVVFATATIAYTTYGGFRAVVWTDVMQGVVMVLGVIVMLGLVLWQVGGLGKATRELAQMTPPETGMAVLRIGAPSEMRLEIRKSAWLELQEADGSTSIIRTGDFAVIEPGELASDPVRILRLTAEGDIAKVTPDELSVPVTVELTEAKPYAGGGGEKGGYVSLPGPSSSNSLGFLTFGTALSFFAFWVFGTAGQPSNMVRQMAFKDSKTLRYSIITVSVYYSIIYFSLVVIFCCARVLLPGMELQSDRIMPQMASHLTAAAGVPWLAGLLVAAPFAAVMSSVDSFLLMMSSSFVRDIYQRNINPGATEKIVKKLTYLITAAVGVAAVLAVLDPPRYLQNLIVFATGGLAGCFLMPVTLAIYWPRMTGQGAIAGMIGGCAMHAILYLIGFLKLGEFRDYPILGMSPFLWDVIASGALVVLVSRMGEKPEERLVTKFFEAR